MWISPWNINENLIGIIYYRYLLGFFEIASGTNSGIQYLILIKNIVGNRH
jgi:hypothetical protein